MDTSHTPRLPLPQYSLKQVVFKTTLRIRCNGLFLTEVCSHVFQNLDVFKNLAAVCGRFKTDYFLTEVFSHVFKNLDVFKNLAAVCGRFKTDYF